MMGTATNARSARGRTILGATLLSGLLALSHAAQAGEITLTHEQLERLVKVVEQRGSHALIPADVSALLGLNAKQIEPDIKQAVYQDEQGNRHGFGRLNDGSGFFMFRSGAALGHSVYRVDLQLHLVKAARALRTNGPLLQLTAAQAQSELDDEFARWARVLSPSGPPPTPFPFKRPEPSSAATAPPAASSAVSR